jgi:uncharacterized protein (TIGR03382 family)
MQENKHSFRAAQTLGKALTAGISAASFALITAPAALAASDTWTGTTDGTWATSTNWAGGNVPGSGNTATFNGAGNGNTTIDLGAGVTLGTLLFDTSSAAAYTIGSGAVGSQTLTLGTVGNAITMNSTVANNELINSNLALATTGTYTVTNNSTTNALTIAGGVSASTTGTKVLSVTGSGNTAISGAITAGSGGMNLLKQGTGTLTLSGGGALAAGTITTFGGTNSAVLLGGTTKISSGTYTSAGEFVVGGVITNGGAGVNTNFTMDGGSLTGSAFLSLGRGNGVGAVSSDIVLNNSASITAANFSAGFNNGSTLNQPKGTFTLNGSSAFTVSGAGVFTLGESQGSNMTMTLNGTSTVTTGTGVVAIGNQNGNGTLNINTGTTFTDSAGEIRVAYSGSNGGFSGTGTINVAGGTLTTKALTLGRNNNTVASTLNGTVNVTAGTVNVTALSTLVGWQGTGASGTLNISGGTFNQSTVTGGSTINLVIGSFTGVTGAVNVSGIGTLNIDNNSNIAFSDTNAVSPTGTLTISGGNIAFYSNAGTTAGGTGVVDLMKGTGTGTNTLNLNGGTLAANQIKATSATGTRVINFNGGTLKSSSSTLASTFLASSVATTANVRNGGAIVDTNGNSVTIGQTLVHSTIGGDNATDGGLTKNGAGTLTLSAANTYTGATAINAGTLALASSGSLSSTTYSIAAGATYDVSTQAYSLNGKSITLSLDAVNPGFIKDLGNTFTLTGGALTLNFTTGAPGSSYTLYSGTTSGDFSSILLSGNGFSGNLSLSGGVWTGTSNGYNFSLTESSGLLSLTAVPESNAMAFAVVGLLGLAVIVRRRRALNE